MALILRIENEATLADGGPTELRITGRRGVDIGRDPYLDWTLPDPSRFISSRHCEIRWSDGGYVLNDISTNGTFVNGNDRRMDGPHRLKHGDRILIGNYIVVATYDDERAPETASAAAKASAYVDPEDLWGATSAAPPIDRSDLVGRPAPVRPDFMDSAFDAPTGGYARAPTSDADRWGAQGMIGRGASPPPPAAMPTSESSGASGHGDGRAPPDGAGAPPSAIAPIWGETEPSSVWAKPDPVAAARPRPAAAAPAPAEDNRAPRAQGNAAAPSPPPGAAVAGPDARSVDLLAELARGAGVPAEVFAQRDPAEVMRDVGEMMRIVVAHMMLLLASRTETKRVMRSTQHTMVGPTDNNPLKFSPTPDEAIRLILGPKLRSYLDGKTALTEGFDDLANHQMRTFAAIQQALGILIADLDPEGIEREAGSESGIAALVGSRKGRLWDLFSARWNAKAAHNEDGMIGQFMLYFADCYDRLGARRNR